MDKLPLDFYDPQFPTQNNEARRQLSVPFNAPALAWHNGFWRPKDSLETWRNNIDKVMLEVYRAAKRLCPTVETPNREGEFLNLFANKVEINDGVMTEIKNAKPERIKFLLPFESSSLTIVAGISKEFWTLTFVLEVFVPKYYRSKKGRSKTPPGVRRIKNLFIRMVKSINSGKMGSVKDGNEETSYRELPFLSFVDFIDSTIVDRAIWHNDFNSHSPWGGKFLDFKGLIVPISPNKSRLCEAPDIGEFGALPLPKKEIAPDSPETYWRLSTKWRNDSKTSPEKTIIPFRWPRKKEWLAVVNKVWPVIQRMHNKIRSPEISISTFQGRRSLYVSSLGKTSATEIGDLAQARRISSVKYLVLVAHHSKWELGRLIDRLHRAGTMRVSAMRDILRIEHASTQLDELRKAISRERNALGDIAARTKKGEGPWNRVFNYHHALREIQDAMPDGLDFRIFRSQYYIQQFGYHAAALRIGRITGFQQYDEFVKRRLSVAFETITMTLERYREARSELDVFLQRVQAEHAIYLGQETKSLNEESVKLNKEAVKLTKEAEAIVGVGSVYYLGFAAATIVAGVGGSAKDKDTFLPIMFTCLLIAFVGWLIRERRRRSRARNRHSLPADL